ncbi:exodeoxyribonuclease VII large subunit [Pseudomonadota bacterium]
MTATPQDIQTQRDIFSVSRLNVEVRAVLEGSFPLLWVEGEISNLARPASGHIYFTLKDAHAQVRCAMFRMRRQHLRFQPENGQQVLIRARVSLFEARGEFQLVAEHMEPSGEGLLRQAFEELKQRLGTEGLFDAAGKKPLPSLPNRIGVITSPTGAAIRDFISILKRRFPLAAITLYPVTVQGKDAATEIARMIRLADQRAECDLLVVTRGGGSLEDLMAFNDEDVARAVHGASLPVVSAVGHEIDFTIIDFVADVRAATPSAAAELISPDRQELEQQLGQLASRLNSCQQRALALTKTHSTHLRQRLNQLHPGVRLRQQQQRMDELEQRLTINTKGAIKQCHAAVGTLSSRLSARTPAFRLAQLQLKQTTLQRQLKHSMHGLLTRLEQRLSATGQHLHAVSPLATLGRGYAIVQQIPSGTILTNAADAKPGDQVKAQLAHGNLLCRVEKIKR